MQSARLQNSILFLLSFLIVSFGQPQWSAFVSFLASTIGFALFFRALLSFSNSKHRFWLATAWFASVQFIQLAWFLSHPFWYIIIVHILVAFLFGLQFGVIGYLADPKKMTSWHRILLLTGIWPLLEMTRLFLFSGFAFNPIGMSLSANLYTLQMASLGGAFGLSFWVLGCNLLALKAWLEWPRFSSFCTWSLCALLPFAFGLIQIKFHQPVSAPQTLNAVLIQPVFPIEESLKFRDTASFIKFVEEEWKQILFLAKPHLGKDIHLMALPEFIVPFTTYSPIYKYTDVENTFVEIFGQEVKNSLPMPQEPLAASIKTPHGEIWMVSNGYWLQSLSNLFKTPIIAGMEDAEAFEDGRLEYYSSAQYTEPVDQEKWQPFQRYEKRVLVPMGEYIPFSFCRKLAASYGITGSFTPGQEAKIFSGHIPFGACICFEETFGHLMRENRQKGAELLVNLTSDAWYPTLAQQHCDHARLRTVENGIPLIRSCNTGITCGFDSLGREIEVLGSNAKEKIGQPGALYLQVPLFSYPTLYSRLGDYFIFLVCCLSIFASFCIKR